MESIDPLYSCVLLFQDKFEIFKGSMEGSHFLCQSPDLPRGFSKCAVKGKGERLSLARWPPQLGHAQYEVVDLLRQLETVS
jgi:hypothetical protein